MLVFAVAAVAAEPGVVALSAVLLAVPEFCVPAAAVLSVELVAAAVPDVADLGCDGPVAVFELVAVEPDVAGLFAVLSVDPDSAFPAVAVFVEPGVADPFVAESADYYSFVVVDLLPAVADHFVV